MKKLLVAIDLANECNGVIEPAAQLARLLDAQLIVATVAPSLPGSEGATRDEARDDLQNSFSEEVHALNDIVDGLRHEGINSRALLLEGGVADELLQTVDTLGIDMLVMGTHSDKSLYDVLLGSNSVQVLKRCKIPMTFIPSGHR